MKKILLILCCTLVANHCISQTPDDVAPPDDDSVHFLSSNLWTDETGYALQPAGDYYIYKACNSSCIKNPLVIIEGIDIGHIYNRTLSWHRHFWKYSYTFKSWEL